LADTIAANGLVALVESNSGIVIVVRSAASDEAQVVRFGRESGPRLSTIGGHANGVRVWQPLIRVQLNPRARVVAEVGLRPAAIAKDVELSGPPIAFSQMKKAADDRGTG